MFEFWGSQEQPSQPHPEEISTHSWYPPSVISSAGSSRPSTSDTSSSGSFNLQRSSEWPQSPSRVSPADAAGIINLLKGKSVEELQKLVSEKEAYSQFLLSLDQVKTQNIAREELMEEILQLARENLEKEPRIMELRNQCRIIQTTELATAGEKLNELEKQKEEILKFYSPLSLLNKLHEAMNKTEEETESLDGKLLDREMDIGAFIQKYERLRTTYHRRALTHLSAKTAYG